MTSFFLFSTFLMGAQAPYTEIELNQLASSPSLYSDPLWKSILHVKGEQVINAKAMGLLSSNDFSLQKELQLTVKKLLEDATARCQYPARLSFLKQKIGYPFSDFSMSACSEYNNFLQKVPNESTFLVYASENVKSASSMLGHIMLRMDGVNNNGIAVSHGITFFTELAGLNVPKILYESLFVGKKGYFQVAPYSEFVKNYLHKEQRNIWEYELFLSDEQKQLIRDITWELGSRDLSYFFHTYNCATVTQLLVASVVPNAIPDLDAWLTPLDVVRFVKDKELVRKTQLIPSNEWQLRALKHSLPEDVVTDSKRRTVRGNIEPNDILDDETKVLNLEFYKEYNQYLFFNEEIDEDRYASNKGLIQQQRTKFDNFDIDVGEYKMPTEASPESQFSFGLSRIQDKNWMKLNWFPVANMPMDNKKHVFGETTLTLSDVSILYSPESNNLKLDSFLLYKMYSRVPTNSMIETYSTGIQFGIERHLDNNFIRKSAVFVNGQLGYTFELSNDVGVFAEVGLGLGSNLSEVYVYVTPKIGVYIYLIGNLKLQSEAYITVNQLNSSKVRESISNTINWSITDKFQLTGEYLKNRNTIVSDSTFSLITRYRF